MIIRRDSVEFSDADKHFTEKFGIERATDMVLDFACTNRHPFIYDTYQLSAFLGLGRKTLFDMSKNTGKYYHELVLAKKNGGVRVINAPASSLKRVQRKILDGILSHFPVSEYATAYRANGNLVKNASVHCGKKYLLKLDISDFFGSIQFYMVQSTVFNTYFFPKQIGYMLTSLCCVDGVLPQGAPTSPCLSNLVLRHFDRVMGAWCKKSGIDYTRYCDDITFSGNEPLYKAYVKAKAMLEDMGLYLNEKKTRFITNASRQIVTGLTVNEKVSVSADYKRKLRQDVYYALKFGLENSVIYSGKSEFIEDNHVNAEKYYCHLVGRISYVLQIEPDNEYFFRVLQKLQELWFSADKL